MSSEDKSPGHKRGIDESEEEIVGPLLSEAIAPKKQKVLEFEKLYLRNLPSTEYYEKSFMHRDVITHIIMAKTDFLITASCDGHVKFWKKMDGEIEFVKHFRAHMGTILDMSGNADGTLCCTASDDKALKVFDVVNFDMINMLKLGYVPSCCCWIHSPGDAISAVAIAEKDTHKISIYDGRGTNQSLKVLDRMHQGTVNLIRYNPVYEVVISSDNLGMLEYWTSYKTDCEMPKVVAFDSKFDTDLYEFFQKQTYPVDITFSPNGQMFVSMGRDRQVRIFNFITGKLKKVIDESLQSFTELQQTKQQLPSMEFGRRMATEKDLERSEAFMRSNIVFDESGHFILFATMLGIKVVNLVTNKCVRFIGRPENTRFLTLALYQGHPRKMRAEPTMEMHASENPTLASSSCTDPTICCTAYKKNRFYIFTQREPIDVKSTEGDRDVLNERPSREELVSATEGTASSRLAASAVIHTTMGDLHIKLFYKECPKSVENFVVHSRNGYYNGHLIHRVIKQFMIQTGDPLGNGTGGESIWGGEFQDEFHPSLKHDRPYTVSMANAGPNTNGSQFFITVIPCPWLDNKHTVFGRISRGMDVVQKMNDVKTDKKTDKPLEEIRIISVTVK